MFEGLPGSLVLVGTRPAANPGLGDRAQEIVSNDHRTALGTAPSCVERGEAAANAYACSRAVYR